MANKNIIVSLDFIRSLVDRFDNSEGPNRLMSETNTFANKLNLEVKR